MAKQKDKGRDFVRNLIIFLDWILVLSPAFELQYSSELHEIEEKLKMPYVTSWERLAKNEGIQQGILEGEMQMLLEQMTAKFDSVPESYHARVTKGDSHSLRLWIRNILQAQTLDEVFKEPTQ